MLTRKYEGIVYGDALYRSYRNVERGVPKYADHKLFEFLILEGAQAELSWITVLRRRKIQRLAFFGCEPAFKKYTNLPGEGGNLPEK